jgi:hypothetical protein
MIDIILAGGHSARTIGLDGLHHEYWLAAAGR